ncbi:MAG: bifunctional demethylmenaquinone methyltransferase/2-methoxy-6-polyprenyl-1,4-benzoquinol methylase UbiE [Candidatus Schekmanbacteria bacterium]|nr:MAG: bifunctional demethylmenaquinone methyltransferase/2-methoxy-6-polyprenyl-1,4-benzoquinol methylase UbiE [Candidatus Schekmanbacteria bacterium]
MATPQYVRRMFASITQRYDLLNHLLSFGLDRSWRKKTAGIALSAGSSVLDICAGTLDLSIEIKEQKNDAMVVSTDFCTEMLIHGIKKIKNNPKIMEIRVLSADAICLPFKDESFNAVTVAFGLRNISQLKKALSEMRRVIKRGGKAVILEFYKPEGLFLSLLFRPYLRFVLPFIGRIISGDKVAYTYLRDSVEGFVSRKEMSERLIEAGFKDVEFKDLSFGIATIHTGVKE